MHTPHADAGTVVHEAPRPLDSGVLTRIGPFGAVAIAAFLVVPLPPAHPGNGPELMVAAGLMTAVVLMCLALPWKRLPAWVQAFPPFLFFGVVGLLRDAEGGASSGYALLMFLPVLWVALHGTRAQLAGAVALAVATVVVPLLVVGSPEYPPDEWRRAFLQAGVAGAMGYVVQQLVAEVRERSATRDAVAGVVRLIADDGDARESICEAACEVAHASAAMLFEPDGEGKLVSTSIAGLEMAPITLQIGKEPSGAITAYLARERFFVRDAATSPAVSRRLSEATGARAVLFEPVLRAGTAVGVLVAVWKKPPRSLESHAVSAIELLAVEAAVAIERTETRLQLEQLARTDPLTGLPNRRTWNEELTRALARARREHRPLTVAMLDLDHFKVLNDAHGHSAGDRVLKESAAAWSGQLREVDLIVRYGGEEFAVMLHDCDLDEARETIERVRAVTASGQTCSAGLAVWDGAETPSALVRRADLALYAAKRGGRDRTEAEPAVARTG